MENKIILDACCGPKMIWFDKKDPRAVYMDIRKTELTACDGRRIIISPDVIGDFRKMPFDDNSFKMVVFDPPHLKKLVKIPSQPKNTANYFLHGKTI